MVYSSHFWHRAFSFSSLPFGLHRWVPALPQGWKISFGLFVRYTVDDPAILPSASTSGGRLRYSPLDPIKEEIRLIKIHAGQREDVIQTSLWTVPLREGPKYEALSYVWGSNQDRETLSVDGVIMAVTRNLYEAIHTLRLPTTDRLVWIDAICICQDNTAERSQQVSIMDQIYQLAENVVVYLGPPNPETEDAIRTLTFFTDPSTDTDNCPWKTTPIDKIERSLMDILHRPWFTRIWTVQEASLARRMTLISGQYEVSWAVNLRTIKRILFRLKSAVISPEWSTPYHSRPSTLDWTPLLNILDTQMRQAARREGASIMRTPLDLAFDFRTRQSVDPRDKYFAIFNIVENDQGGRLVLQPDYRTTLEELHQQFTKEVERISDL